MKLKYQTTYIFTFTLLFALDEYTIIHNLLNQLLCGMSFSKVTNSIKTLFLYYHFFS